jgi:hypothetical protein
VRELDERLGFGELIEQYLTDSRGKNAQFCFAERRPVGKACSLLLAIVGGEPSDVACILQVASMAIRTERKFPVTRQESNQPTSRAFTAAAFNFPQFRATLTGIDGAFSASRQRLTRNLKYGILSKHTRIRVRGRPTSVVTLKPAKRVHAQREAWQPCSNCGRRPWTHRGRRPPRAKLPRMWVSPIPGRRGRRC